MKRLIAEKQSIFLRASISDLCNFSCQYCPSDLGMENHTPTCLQAPVLRAEEYLRNLHWIAQHGFQNITFTGGEPLLCPYFADLAKACRSIFRMTEITTNGTQLIRHMDTVQQYIDVLKISMDAVTPELAAQIARNPAAARTPQIVEECCRAGVKTIGLNFVYMKQNAQELPKLIDFAAELKQKYGTEIYISVLDLYYSEGNRQFWQAQFADLAQLRSRIAWENTDVHRRLRVGCDSYNFVRNGITVNMKDSISCTHRAEMCETCTEYCQEGIYSLKHSASGWIGVCPTNHPAFGTLLHADITESEAHDAIDKYVDIINSIVRVDHTGADFCRRRNVGDAHA